MQDFGTKADNSPPPGGQLSAAEFNNLATENENAVLRSGIALSGASATQLAESLFLHGVKSESFQDSGVANAYVATPTSGSGGVLLPSSYTNLGGAVFCFKAANANSGASTLNIGQTTGALLGTKPIRTSTDAALPSGAIVSGQYVQVIYNPAFNSGAGAWELLPWSLVGTLGKSMTAYLATGSFSFVVPAFVTKVKIRAIGGGGGAGGSAAARSGGGGGGGGYSEGWFSVTPGSSLAVTVGAGGAGGTAGNVGVTGGTTSVGALLAASGGAFGDAGGGGSGSGGFGGTGSGGQVNSIGGDGGDGTTAGTVGAGQGGGSALGGTTRSGTTGRNALGIGGGGSASYTLANNSGGNGFPGAVIVEY